MSSMPSFDFRLLIRLLGRFSAFALIAGLESLLGVSEGVVIARLSSLGELGVLDDECLRWGTVAGNRCGGDILERVEHDRHVQVFRRTNSLE